MTGAWDCRPPSDCCEAHDGPHLHACILPRTEQGFTHPGPCILPAPSGGSAA